MTTQVGVSTQTGTLSVRFRYDADAWPKGIPLEDFSNIIVGIQDLVILCIPRIRIYVRSRPEEDPLPSASDRQPHQTRIRQLSYNSPLEILLVISASTTVISSAALSFLRVARAIDDWRQRHADVRTKIAISDLQVRTIQALDSIFIKSGTGTPRQIRQVSRAIEALKVVESIEVDKRGS